MWQRFHMVVRLNRLNFLIVSHRFSKFTGHRPCGSSAAAAKIVYVTLQDHLIKVSVIFMEGNSSFYIPCQDRMILVCHVILQYHVTKESCDFMGRSFFIDVSPLM